MSFSRAALAGILLLALAIGVTYVLLSYQPRVTDSDALVVDSAQDVSIEPTDAYLREGNPIQSLKGQYAAYMQYNLASTSSRSGMPAASMDLLVKDLGNPERSSILIFSMDLIYGPATEDNEEYPKTGFADNGAPEQWLVGNRLLMFISPATSICARPMASQYLNIIDLSGLRDVGRDTWTAHSPHTRKPFLTDVEAMFEAQRLVIASTLDPELRTWEASVAISPTGRYLVAAFIDPDGPSAAAVCGDIAYTRMKIYSFETNTWLPGYIERLPDITPQDQTITALSRIKAQEDGSVSYEVRTYSRKVMSEEYVDWFESPQAVRNGRYVP